MVKIVYFECQNGSKLHLTSFKSRFDTQNIRFSPFVPARMVSTQKSDLFDYFQAF